MNRERMIENLGNIPRELKGLKRWCGYMANSDGSINKKPFSIADYKAGVKAYEVDRLVTFDVAEKALKDGKIAAVGFAFRKSDGYMLFDVDMHDDRKRAKYNEISRDILSRIKGYAETSVSGCGTHIIVKATKPKNYKNKCKFGIMDLMDDKHCVILTGNIIEGRSSEIIECQDDVDKFLEDYFKMQEEKVHFIEVNQYEVSDTDLINKIKSTYKGKHFLSGDWAKILKTVDGEKIQAYSSQSEADLAFIMQLLFYNGNNPAQAEKIFRNSKMFREKGKSQGYVTHCVSVGTIQLSAVYDWNKIKTDVLEEEMDFEDVLVAAAEIKIQENIRKYGFRAFNNPELNKYVSKYIQNYGIAISDVVDTRMGDYDNASNGVRFYLKNKDDLLYVENSKEWFSWDSKKWNLKDSSEMLANSEKVFHSLKHEAYRLAMSILNELDEYRHQEIEKEALELFKYASTAKNKRNCLEMIDFAKSHFIKENPEIDMDKNINALNLQNGLFDFDKMELVAHSKEYYQTRICNVEYDKDANCDVWTTFLSMVIPNTEVRRYLQKIIGYTLSGFYNEKLLLILCGSGDNGKTTLVNTIKYLLGTYATTVAPSTIIDSTKNRQTGPRPDLLKLRDRRLYSVSEFEKEATLSEALIKNATGMGAISCRDLHKSTVEFNVEGKIWMDTNYRPVVNGTDYAIWSRLKIIPFKVSIPKHRQDKELSEKLKAELAGMERLH